MPQQHRVHPGSQRVRQPLHARALTVHSRRRLSATLVELRLRGDFEAQPLTSVTGAAAEHVKLIVPDAKTGVLTLPRIVDGRLAPPVDGAAWSSRDYTVRAFTPASADSPAELVLWGVEHPHGPVGAWVAGAAVGDTVGVIGPRGSELFPTDYPHYLVGADETALPALTRWIEEAPHCAHLTVFAEVAHAGARIELPHRDNATVTWLYRDAGESLATAIGELPTNLGNTFVWVAGEAGALIPLRRHLLRERGLDRNQIDISGYWKRGVADLDHHLPLDAEDPEN
ncbi:siderophore-interacting protein [Mycetocola tolaasinivorans]|uniref:Siderophore-interacting protein n=1 Tax=Mycetocola tolaasinivorans TaxID=76635 RepID=A0A3L7A349_9MICO|nr:siderophore-interacting protein [Mycetocola tolaasinivorans]RLP74514.1 siderophore-interacting protein [Mycetocola tolaasinivorans]